MLATRRMFIKRSLSGQLFRRYSDSAAVPPPLLTKLRADLKTAMKAKDKERLNVVKSIISEISNAGMANPPKPVKSDLDILVILRSMNKKIKASIEDFEKAGRQDLVDKEKVQFDIIKDYTTKVDVMSEEELGKLVTSVIDAAKAGGSPTGVGDIVKAVTAAAAAKGSVIVKSDIAAAAKKALGM